MCTPGIRAFGRQDVGDVPVADGVEDVDPVIMIVPDLQRDQEKRAAVDEPAGEGGDEGRDAQARHGKAVIRRPAAIPSTSTSGIAR